MMSHSVALKTWSLVARAHPINFPFSVSPRTPFSSTFTSYNVATMNEFSSARLIFRLGRDGHPTASHKRSTSSTSTLAVVLNTTVFPAGDAALDVAYGPSTTSSSVALCTNAYGSTIVTDDGEDDDDDDDDVTSRDTDTIDARARRAPFANAARRDARTDGGCTVAAVARDHIAGVVRVAEWRRRSVASLDASRRSQRRQMHGRRRQTAEERERRREANIERVRKFNALQVRAADDDDDDDDDGAPM